MTQHLYDQDTLWEHFRMFQEIEKSKLSFEMPDEISGILCAECGGEYAPCETISCVCQWCYYDLDIQPSL